MALAEIFREIPAVPHIKICVQVLKAAKAGAKPAKLPQVLPFKRVNIHLKDAS